MNVGELKAALDAYPDDMPVAVIDRSDRGPSDLDTDIYLDTAINHPGTRPRGHEDWHWESDETVDAPGEKVLVIY